MSEYDRTLFDRIAAQYGAKDRRFANVAARRLRLEQTLKAAGLAHAGNVLEVGCGAGYGARYLSGRFERYVGVDHSSELAAIAGVENGGANIRFIAGAAEELKGEGLFDTIFMIGVLHHVDDDAGLLRHLVDMLQPGGWLLANEPQSANPVIQLSRHVRKWVDSAYSVEQRYYNKAELEGLWRAAGLESVRVVPQGLLSTPFAEVVLPDVAPVRWASSLSCRCDRALEAMVPSLLKPLSWNLVAAGRKAG